MGSSMAKKNVSARVPPKIADGIDEYAELWDLNRTDALTLLLKDALEEPPKPRHVDEEGDVNPTERVYTVELEPENADFLEEKVEEGGDSPEEVINRLLRVYK